MIYKDKNCINELGLEMPEIDFGECYKEIQSNYGLENKDLIVAIIDKRNNKESNPITSYVFYHPENGVKLNAEEICKEKVIIVNENLKSLLNESVSDIDSILFLTGQNINVFNKSCEFYTNICYHFDSPCGKDIALRDRLLIYYPNITLCDLGCSNIGINLTSMTAICECKYKDLSEDDPDQENNIYKDVVNQVNNILNQVNLAVMKCYEDIFNYELFICNIGGIVLLILILIKIGCIITYYYSNLFLINKYIYNVTHNYLLYLNKSPFVNTNIINYKNNNDDNEKGGKKINCPIKKNNSNKYNNDLYKIKNDSGKKINNIKNIKIIKTEEELKTINKLNKSQKYKKITLKTKSYSSKKLKNSEQVSKANSPVNMNKSEENKGLIFENYLSTDFDDMDFHDVALSDKRLFFDYLFDKLKRKQSILQLFYMNSPLRPITIKILLLILEIEICLIINALFINEDFVSTIFHSKKEENIISFLPRSINRCIYTIFVRIVVNYFIVCLFVDETKIKGILKREKKDITNMKYQINLVMKQIKIRYNIFIIINSILSIFSWYYISCFNNIYPHMKIEWIKSSIFIIIIIIYILSIIIIIIETILRFISFELKSERMYRASLWLG